MGTMKIEGQNYVRLKVDPCQSMKQNSSIKMELHNRLQKLFGL